MSLQSWLESTGWGRPQAGRFIALLTLLSDTISFSSSKLEASVWYAWPWRLCVGVWVCFPAVIFCGMETVTLWQSLCRVLADLATLSDKPMLPWARLETHRALFTSWIQARIPYVNRWEIVIEEELRAVHPAEGAPCCRWAGLDPAPKGICDVQGADRLSNLKANCHAQSLEKHFSF